MDYNGCIQKSIEYIEKNLDTKIELKDIADKVFLFYNRF
jgi:AraC family transcriptional regulator